MGSGDTYSTRRLRKTVSYVSKYLLDAREIIEKLDGSAIDRMVDLIIQTRSRRGRIFVLGVGGGAGHASHAVADFRKIAGIEAYTPSDNVSELTARINDEGWETAYAAWLAGSHLRADDLVFVFSVGGGDLERNISSNLVRALEYACMRRRSSGRSFVGTTNAILLVNAGLSFTFFSAVTVLIASIA